MIDNLDELIKVCERAGVTPLACNCQPCLAFRETFTRECILALLKELKQLREMAAEFAAMEGDDAEGRVEAMRTFHGK